MAKKDYPYEDGDVVVLGPQIFADKDGLVINWKGQNYTPQQDGGWSEEESGLCQHAKRELERAGLFDQDSDYGGMLARDAYEIIKVFARQGHSGMSAAMTTNLVTTLMWFKPLTPITSDPDEWMDVSEMSSQPLWQCKRDPSVFSKDGGATWSSIEEQAEEDS